MAVRFGRLRRRRLLLFFVFAVFLTFYIGYSPEQSDQQTSQFIPTSSPEDELETEHRSPAAAAPPPPKEAADIPAALRPEERQKILKEAKEKEALKRAEEEKRKRKKLSLIELLKKPMDPMEYGTAARPAIKGLTNIIADLPVELTVDNKGEEATAESLLSQPAGLLRRRRFVFVGDVHGQRRPLDELLAKIDFDVGNDHLVLVGDMINKGPNSTGVVQLAMDLGASAVRGNHEDRVLVAYESLRAAELRTSKPRAVTSTADDNEYGENEDENKKEKERQATLASIEAEGKMERAAAMLQREVDLQEEAAAKGKGILTLLGLKKEKKSEEDVIDHDKMVAELDIDPLEKNPFSHEDSAERATAATLTPEQANWLSELPVILRLGKIAPPPAAVSVPAEQANTKSPFNNVVVVHAGLVPELPLERQDPYAVMVMRSLVRPADELRHERAGQIAEEKIRTEARGRIKATEHVNVPKSRVEAEYHRMQKVAFGPDPHHPRRPSPPGSPKSSKRTGNPEPADLVMLPIEGHFREGHDRVHWAAVWNQAQHAIAEPENRTTVIYGHDAITGLLVPETMPSGLFSLFSSDGSGSGGSGSNGAGSGSVITEADTGYTFGLDSGAVYGGKLTALIVEADEDGLVKHRIEQVPCPPIAPKKYAD